MPASESAAAAARDAGRPKKKKKTKIKRGFVHCPNTEKDPQLQYGFVPIFPVDRPQLPRKKGGGGVGISPQVLFKNWALSAGCAFTVFILLYMRNISICGGVEEPRYLADDQAYKAVGMFKKPEKRLLPGAKYKGGAEDHGSSAAAADAAGSADSSSSLSSAESVVDTPGLGENLVPKPDEGLVTDWDPTDFVHQAMMEGKLNEQLRRYTQDVTWFASYDVAMFSGVGVFLIVVQVMKVL